MDGGPAPVAAAEARARPDADRRAPAGTTGLLRIADAARAVGVSPSALRLWERQGLVSPVRHRGRERRYGPDELTRLRCIRRLRAVEGLNAAGIRRALGEDDLPLPHRAPGDEDGAAAAIAGARLRALRRTAGLSLREVAARTGLSASFVSGLERGTSGASVAALARLAKAYGTSVAALAGERDTGAGGGGPGDRVVRRGARPVSVAGHGVRIEELARQSTQLQPQLFVLAPGATSDGSYAHAGEEFLFVIAGRLAVWLDERECHELAAGDALTFPSSLPHRFVALGGDETRVLWVNTPPTF